ncbi:MAG: hypothetical protein ABIP21_09800 [Acidimicrobiia bacterium]
MRTVTSQRRSRRIVRAFTGVVLTVALVSACGATATERSVTSPQTRPKVSAFAGLGTWVDVYDYGPKFQSSPTLAPALTVDAVDDMARLGVKTIYLQAAQDDTRSDGLLADRELVSALLRRAHRRNVKIVAWYLPHFADVNRDLGYVRALARYRSHGQRFDGIALDIEWTNDVPDPVARNRALIELAHRARGLVTGVPLGAIVLEPVLIEDVNRNHWPNFPWRELRNDFDVWLPMSYWTNRSTVSGWKDGFRYSQENIKRVRANLHDPRADVHVVGGIADRAEPREYARFVAAAQQSRAVGWSIYDYVTTSSSAWPRLRG